MGGEPNDEVVCTLSGGAPAAQRRMDEWRAVLGRAVGREPRDGGVELVFEPDPAVTAELGRLAAAEAACCAFFTFTLVVDAGRVRFAATAPAAAAGLVAELFGATP